MHYFPENTEMEIEELKNDNNHNRMCHEETTRIKLVLNAHYCKSARGFTRIVIIVLLTPCWLVALFTKNHTENYFDWAGYESTRIAYIIATVVSQTISLIIYFLYIISIDRINSSTNYSFSYLVIY